MSDPLGEPCTVLPRPPSSIGEMEEKGERKGEEKGEGIGMEKISALVIIRAAAFCTDCSRLIQVSSASTVDRACGV